MKTFKKVSNEKEKELKKIYEKQMREDREENEKNKNLSSSETEWTETLYVQTLLATWLSPYQSFPMRT